MIDLAGRRKKKQRTEEAAGEAAAEYVPAEAAMEIL